MLEKVNNGFVWKFEDYRHLALQEIHSNQEEHLLEATRLWIRSILIRRERLYLVPQMTLRVASGAFPIIGCGWVKNDFGQIVFKFSLFVEKKTLISKQQNLWDGKLDFPLVIRVGKELILIIPFIVFSHDAHELIIAYILKVFFSSFRVK